jgi:hypothetical protein
MPLTNLKKSARKAGLKTGSKRYKAYVYGTEQEIKRRRRLKIARKMRKK